MVRQPKRARDGGRGLPTRRRLLTETAIGVVLGAIAVVVIMSCVRSFMPSAQKYPSIPEVNGIGLSLTADHPGGTADTPASRISSIPVLSYHQMDNGCVPTAQLCTTSGFTEDNVTQRQFYDQMSWLYSHGYRTVTAEQYIKWVTGKQVMLPAKPVLLTVDDGIVNFYAGATPVLRNFGFSMVSMVVSGFAQGAQDNVRRYRGWDATWTQLANLPSGTWEFAFHAGPAGHLLTPGTNCQYFYPCMRSGETAAAYKTRTAHDIDAGLAAVQAHLGSRVSTDMWAVPFNDLAQPGAEQVSGAVPRTWLNDYAQRKFAVVFVDGQTSRANQHYRYEVHGTDTLTFFASQLNQPDVFSRNPGPATATARPGGRS